MNDEHDHLARWVHALCAIPVLLFAAFQLYLLVTGSWFSLWLLFRGGSGITAVYLAYRLLWYAITGKRNINMDEY